MGSNAEIVVVVVPLPAQGHLNQLLHFSHLITSYGIPVHYAGSATHNHQAKVRLHGWDPESATDIHFHDFQLPPYSSPPLDPSADDYPIHLLPLLEASTHLRQPVFQLLQQLSAKFQRVVIIIIHDNSLASVVQDMKLIPNAECYAFFPVSAFTLFSSSWDNMPKKPFHLDSDILPSCTPSHKGSIPQEILNFLASQYKFLGLESGRLYNTSRLIEGRYFKLLEKLSPSNDMKYFAVGPLNPVKVRQNRGGQSQRCLDWLDRQEKDSVIYISFGSTTSMSSEQINELATGLETSAQKFIWVLRTADRGDIFADSEVQIQQLPEGFEKRISSRGLVIRDWAPQLEILAHSSTGGFMSHCGWNSCMESITMGVPIAAWPMHSDQPKNAVLATEVLKIGTLVRDWPHLKELVRSNTIADAVRRLMASDEGEMMRKRATELGEGVRGSAAQSSTSSEMDLFIAHVTR